MRLFFLLFSCALLSAKLMAQQTAPANNLLLGYQEFPTVITSHAADEDGNQYYTGFFRGQLTVNKKVLTQGDGLEDIFWIKTTAAGEVITTKTYGSTDSENTYPNSLAMGKTNMLFGFGSRKTLQVGSHTFIPYQHGDLAFAVGLVCTDTSGTVLWVRKTNLQNFRIFFSNNIYHIIGSVPYMFPAITLDDLTIVDSIGRTGFVHLMLDDKGKFLGAKSITARKPGQSVTLMNTGSFSDKSLFLQIRVDGDSAFYINNKPVELPPTFGGYQTLLKIDTGYQHFRYRVLNPQRHAIAGLANLMFPSTTDMDSVYVAFNCESNPAPFYLDGILQQQLRNHLYVFDSTLVLRRQVSLGNSFVGSYATNIYKRRIYFRQMLVQNGQVFLNGVYTGVNESPLNTIPVNNVTVGLFPDVTASIDQNGPSQSFMARCNINGQGGILRWYGNHSEYENINVAPAYLHTAGLGRIAFHQIADNVWNPWMIDQNLNVLSGSMRKTADMPETPQMIKYFSDGSRLVIGYARGKTALDSNGTFTTNGGRRDLFLVRLRANNQVAWFKRIQSTLTSPEIRRLEVRNGQAYLLVNYLGTQNDSNYIKVDNNAYNVRVNASLLASVDTAGNIKVLNLTNPLFRTVYLMNFAFFSNGDLAVATDVNPVMYQSFPANFSPQIFRLNATTGAILEGRKFISAGFGIFSMQIDKNDQLYICGSINTSTGGNLSMHNGSSMAVGTLQIPSTTQPQFSLLKMSWNQLLWMKRASGNAQFKQIGDMILVNDKPLIGLLSSPAPQSLLWDGQTVHTGVSVQSYSLIALSADGAMIRKKTLSNVMPNYLRAGSNNQFYASGIIRSAVKIDTIQIGFGGGIVDAIGLVFDSTLTTKRSFRVASAYSESMTDMDMYGDTVAALAYTAQGNPQVYLNRTAAAVSDYEEDAYLGTINTRSNVVTSINNPLPPQTHISIMPNPVTGDQLQVTAQVTEVLRSTCTIYQSNGQHLSTTVLQFTPGNNRYRIQLPEATGKGVYHVVITNKRWTTTRTFIVL